MILRLAADAVLVVHLAFIVFVLLGGVLVQRRPVWAAIHLPAVAWGAFAELSATVCPLTPLENWMRASAGDAGYQGGFVEHYVLPIIYPPGLTPHVQTILGIIVIGVNVFFYGSAWRRARRLS